jgi:hypothetical protein
MAEAQIVWKRVCGHSVPPTMIPVKIPMMLYDHGTPKGRITNLQQPMCTVCGTLYQMKEGLELISEV